MFQPYVDLTQQFRGDVILNDILPTREGMWLAMREGVFFVQGQKLIPVVRNVYVNTIVPTNDHLLFCTRNGVLAYARRNGGVPTADMKLPTLLTYNVESGYYDHIYNKVWLGGFLNGLRIFTFDEGGTLIEHELSAKDICAIRGKTSSLAPIPAASILPARWVVRQHCFSIYATTNSRCRMTT